MMILILFLNYLKRFISSGKKKIKKIINVIFRWTLIDLKLMYGVERGVLLGGKANQFIIFGGKIRSGDTKMIYVYDLFKESYTFEKEM